MPLPAWLTSNLYPPTSELDLRIAKASDEANRLRSVVADLERERNERRSIVGLLYESGQRLEDLVAAALDELGAALGQAIANEEFTALYGGIVAAVEVKGNAKSASQDDLRALADYLTGHDLTDDYAGSRGVLVVNAWRNLPLDDRGDWFPDNVAKAAVTGGRISLVRSIDLYRAVVDLRAGNAGPSTSFMDRVFSESGRIRY